MAASHEFMLAEIAAAAVQCAATMSRVRTDERSRDLDRADVRSRVNGMRERLDSILAGLEPQTPAEVVERTQRLIDEACGAEVVPFGRRAAPDPNPEPPRAA